MVVVAGALQRRGRPVVRLPDSVKAIAIAAQQHGLVALDGDGDARAPGQTLERLGVGAADSRR